ncbi:DUF374 domain-containing protein [bacterium]|nr:DUF374 domain-containing protein [bacterium]
MVRLSNEATVQILGSLLYKILNFQAMMTEMVAINEPKENCLYAIWHAHQLSVHSMKDNKNGALNVMISHSRDGKIVAKITQKWGINVIRASFHRKGCISGSKELVDKLKAGECGAIMVDGPRGPKEIVKDGVIKLAKMAQKPIVPTYMFSSNKTLLTLPGWDGLRLPFFITKIVVLHGEPIYVKENASEEEIELCRQEVQKSMEHLKEIAPQKFKEVFRFGLWKRKNF